MQKLHFGPEFKFCDWAALINEQSNEIPSVTVYKMLKQLFHNQDKRSWQDFTQDEKNDFLGTWYPQIDDITTIRDSDSKPKHYFSNAQDSKLREILNSIILDPDYSLLEKSVSIELFESKLKDFIYEQGWDEDSFDYVKHWFCNLKRRLLGKTTAQDQILTLMSVRKGTGKTTFAHCLNKALKELNADGVRTIEAKELSEQFATWKKWNGVLYFDENPRMREGSVEILKSLITNQDNLNMQVKYSGDVSVRQRFVFLMTCNRGGQKLFYGEAGERRNAIVPFDNYRKEKTEIELIKQLKELILVCPVDYWYSPVDVSRKAVEETSTNVQADFEEFFMDFIDSGADDAILLEKRSVRSWSEKVLNTAKRFGVLGLNFGELCQFIEQDFDKQFFGRMENDNYKQVYMKKAYLKKLKELAEKRKQDNYLYSIS